MEHSVLMAMTRPHLRLIMAGTNALAISTLCRTQERNWLS